MAKRFALISRQGTACAETCHCENCATPTRKMAIEQAPPYGAFDPPDLSAGWQDVTDNDACWCQECGDGDQNPSP